MTVERLQSVLAPLLGVRDPSTLEPDVPLMSFGLDSLTAVEFARALSREFGRPVAPDFIYNHPTLEQAARALATRRPPAQRASNAVLRVPRWAFAASSRTVSRGWTVAGENAIAQALRAVVAPDPANLVDLSAMEAGQSDGGAAYSTVFPAMLARLRPLLGRPAHVVLVTPSSGALAGAVEGFAAGLRAEQLSWTVKTVRLDLRLADPVSVLVREMFADDGNTRVRLSHSGRQAVRMHVLPAADAGASAEGWRPSPELCYLVTGGSGGIGTLVASHLVTRGARHLVLASRRPVLPAALSGTPAHIRLYPVDIGKPDAVAAMMTDLRRARPPLGGIFHTAGVTADGTVAASDWPSLARAFPAKADGALALDRLSRDLDLDVFALFSSITAWFGLPGTVGYAAANGFLDGLAEERAAAGLPAVSIAWGAWQGVGMARDPALWQGGRVPSLPAQTALRALDMALATGEVCVLPADTDWLPAFGGDLSRGNLIEPDLQAAAGGHA